MKAIYWKLHLKTEPKVIFDFLATSDGRAKFWSEQANEENGLIHFVFPNGQTYDSSILKIVPNTEFHIDYFNSLVKFKLKACENGGTDLSLINEGVAEREFSEVNAGWVSVLMNLKAVADFHCDLRNHNPIKTWDQGYVDN